MTELVSRRENLTTNQVDHRHELKASVFLWRKSWANKLIYFLEAPTNLKDNLPVEKLVIFLKGLRAEIAKQAKRKDKPVLDMLVPNRR